MSIVIALALALVPQDLDKDLVKAEMARHEANWAVESYEHDGTAANADVVKSITRDVRGDHVTWRRDGKPFSGSTLSLDIKADPRRITITPDGGQGRDKPVRGIYKFDGEKLIVCMAEPGAAAPKEFTAEKGSRRTLMTLRRGAPAAKRPRKP